MFIESTTLCIEELSSLKQFKDIILSKVSCLSQPAVLNGHA